MMKAMGPPSGIPAYCRGCQRGPRPLWPLKHGKTTLMRYCVDCIMEFKATGRFPSRRL